VPDDVLTLIAGHDGGDDDFTWLRQQRVHRWNADGPPKPRASTTSLRRLTSPTSAGGRSIGSVKQQHPQPVVTIAQVADHIDHIVKVAGIDHVGLGSDFDGIEVTPRGLESVADYPNLFAELIRRGWTDDMLAKLAGQNLLRVMRKAEAVAASMKALPPAS
jgi:membrane dipeptidase